MKKSIRRLISCITFMFILMSFSVYMPAIHVSAISHSEVETKLSSLMNKYVGTRWTSTYAGAKECKGFASMIFNEIFDLGGKSIGTGSVSSNSTNYKLNDLHPDVQLIGTVHNGSDADVKNLLMKAMPGDFIQLRRRSSGGPHSEIVVSVSDSGIDIFDCNTDGKCTVKHYSQSFSTFNGKNIGISLYHSKKYNNTPTVCNCSGGYAGRYTTYNVDTSLNIRSESAHSLSGSKVGSIPAGAEFDVTKADGTIAHVNYNGTVGIVSMAYIQKVSSGNDSGNDLNVNLHVWVSDTPMGGVPNEYSVNNGYYLCFELTDLNSGKKLNDVSSSNYTVTETVYKPDGSKLFEFSYDKSDNNWIKTTPDVTGTYKGVVSVTGDFTGSSSVSYFANSGNITFHSWISDTEMGNQSSDYVLNGVYYLCYELTDEGSGKKMNEAYAKNYTVTEAVYNPDGSKLFEYTYENSDYNWIRVQLEQIGTYKYVISIKGDISETIEHPFTVSKHEHSFGAWTTEKAATCTENGSKYRKCTLCGEKETDSIPKTGHDYTEKIIAPTASEKGYTLHTCTRCGDSYKDNYTDTLKFEFTASASSVNIDIDENEKKSVIFSYKNVPENIEKVIIVFNNGENKVTDLEWGEWDKNSIPLYISGCCAGKEKITVELYDKATKELLALKTIDVTVTAAFAVHFDAGDNVNFVGIHLLRYGEKYGSLPMPERPGYELIGWFTEKNGGTEIKADTVVNITSEHTLYAHWKSVYSAGDVNNDGSVGVSDIVALQKYIIQEQDFNAFQLAAADVNDDGNINVFDVIAIKRHILSLQVIFMPPVSLIPLK